MRKTTLLWLFLAVFCGSGIFHTSQKVHDERTRIAELNASIAKEEESLRVLNAEWSYLNQPARLEKLAKTYLRLAPLKGNQFVKAESIPLRGTADAEAAPVVTEKKTEQKKPEKIAEKKTFRPHLAATKPRIEKKIIKEARLSLPSADKDEESDEAAPIHKTGIKAASTHNFADLMKNLRSGIE